MSLSDRLRELRLQRGLTMAELARRAKVDRSLILYVERGKSRLGLDVAKRIAIALGVSLDDLAEMGKEDKG